MKSKIIGLMFVSLGVLLTAVVTQAIPVYSEQEINEFLQQQKQIVAEKEQKVEAIAQKAQETVEQSLQHKEQALSKRSTPSKKKDEPTTPDQMGSCDCYDPTDAYNYKGNFLYDGHGNRVQRKLPTPCKCLKAPSNQKISLPSNGSTTPTTTDQSSTSNGWNIQY